MKAGVGYRIWPNLYNLLLKLPLGKSKSWPTLNWFRLGHTADSLFLVAGKRRAFEKIKTFSCKKGMMFHENAVWSMALLVKRGASAREEAPPVTPKKLHFFCQDLDNIFISLCWMAERCNYLQLFLLLHIASPLFLQFSKTGCFHLSQAGLDPAIKIGEWRMFPGREAPQRKEVALTPGTVGSWIFCLSSW